jgi:TPR repeat protein/dsRNA-specific ribonuclease
MIKLLSIMMSLAFFINPLQAMYQDKDDEIKPLSPQLLFPKASISSSTEATAEILLNYEFSIPSLLEAALQPRTPEFERLEFLGDRVLGLVTAHYLHKKYPLKDIGGLTKIFTAIVSNFSLARMYQDLKVDPSKLSSFYYQAPIGMISQKIASDIIEALMGAIYIDGGFEALQEIAEQFIETYHFIADKEKSTPIRPISSCSKIDEFIFAKGLFSLQETISYHFKDSYLLYEAFNYPSARLGFIGPHVLALTIADRMFTGHPQAKEGYLMQGFEKTINNNNMKQVFQNWQLWRYLGKQHVSLTTTHSAPQAVSKRMAVDTVRALIGAVYLDGGWDEAQFITYKLLFFRPPDYFVKPDACLADNLKTLVSAQAREILHQDKLSINHFSPCTLKSEESLNLSDNSEDNSQMALLYHTKAAEQGDANSQYYLAIHGKGPWSEHDEREAIDLLFKAAKQGHPDAQFYLGWIYADGHHGIKGDDAQAVHWFLKAAEQGLSRAQCNLGFMYAKGRGVMKDEAHAINWFLKAAEQGLSRAQYNLGLMYANGQGVTKDEAQAISWFLKAAEQGDSGAQFYLGSMYEKGQGIEKDDLQAFNWFYQAAKQRECLAKEMLRFKFAFNFSKLKGKSGGARATIGLKLSFPSTLSQRIIGRYH